MRSYKDRHGNQRQVSITLGTRRRIREDMQLDILAAAGDPKLLDQLVTTVATDEAAVMRMLAIVHGTTSEALEEAFDGTVFDQAQTALMEAIIDFFPESNPVRQPLLALIHKAKTFRDETCSRMASVLTEHAEKLDLDTVFSSSETPTAGSGESAASADSDMQPTAMI